MIELKHVTKQYGLQTAVEDLTFTVRKGCVCGFLGPNGAGKSTTLNILTGCLAPSEGDVRICGVSLLDEPEEAKRHIGFLPEIPPVYPDMTTEEYLRFAGDLIGYNRKKRAEEAERVMKQLALIGVRGKLIRNLSKGYRQRVGLAQALVGDPDVLVLDEPTAGLDPKQIGEFLDLIRSMKEEKTILISSHIISEIAEICDTLLILSEGTLAAEGTAEDLIRKYADPDPLRRYEELRGGQKEVAGSAQSGQRADADVAAALRTKILTDIYFTLTSADGASAVPYDGTTDSVSYEASDGALDNAPGEVPSSENSSREVES